MNAGELVVSLLLKAGDFKAQVQSAQERLDGVQAAAVDVGRATYDAGVKGAQGLGQSADAASSLQAAFDEAVQKGREISEVTKEYQRMREELIRTGATKERLEALDDAAKKLGVSLEDAADKGAFGFERLKSVAAQALAVIGGVSILKSSIAQYYEQAQAIEKTSDALGMSIEDWQAWQRTAASAGVDAEELSTRFMDLGDWMQDLILHDSGPLKDATKDLGVSFTDAKGKAVSFEEGLLRLSDATSKIDRQKATSILTQIGFDEKTIPLILKGRKGIEELLKVQKAQAIYSKQDIENAKKQREAQQRLNDAWEAISALFAYDKNGIASSPYLKQVLVPFGEKTPFAGIFHLDTMSECADERHTKPLTSDGMTIGSVICIESIFPSLVSRQKEQGAQLICVSTNDSWFGKSSAREQHYRHCIMRAVENRRYVLRAGNCGISAIISPTGEQLSVKSDKSKGAVWGKVTLIGR